MAILRIAEGLDCSAITNANGDDEHGVLAQSSYDLAGNTLMHADSDLSMSTQIPRVQSVPTIGKNRYYMKEKDCIGFLPYLDGLSLIAIVQNYIGFYYFFDMDNHFLLFYIQVN